MKRIGIVLLGVAAWLVFPSLVFAQRTQTTYSFSAVGTNGLGQLSLLQHPSVQNELELTGDQIGRVGELLKDQERWFRDSRGGDLAEKRSREDARSAELEAAISGFLTDQQVKRLKQIGLQQQGAWALADPKISDALELTAAQKEEVRSLTTAARFKMRGFGTPGRSPNRENAESVRKATSDKLLALLTEEQQTKWKDLVGKPFEGEIRRP